VLPSHAAQFIILFILLLRLLLCALLFVCSLVAMMDPTKFRSILYDVAKQLKDDDLKSLKFLVTDIIGIDRQRLEEASNTDFLLILMDQNMITSSDVSFLAELLREIRRLDLHKTVINNFRDIRTCRLPVIKVLMFRIAQSMTKSNMRDVCYYYDVQCDAVDLMTVIEAREPVGSVEELRRVINEAGLSRLYDAALQTLSFCDGTGCDELCVHRQLWSEKFPHQLSPLFNGEILLNQDDRCTDGENTVENLLGEGRLGKVYRGQ